MFPNIDAERGRNNLSKAALARKLGVSYSTFKSWMSGKTDIPSSKIIEMTRLFGVTADYLLGIDRHDNESA